MYLMPLKYTKKLKSLKTSFLQNQNDNKNVEILDKYSRVCTQCLIYWLLYKVEVSSALQQLLDVHQRTYDCFLC